ncbi:terminase small subunit [Gordonia phage Neville]|uniref:Terminase small subunit n=2 Tax=Nevillevirus TaxID=3044773 RepID=A0A515MGV1_9CAUD|nr:terminase small subunit [Gordonia phage Neville]YP_010245996.1 terminase small subunit [Gordonia phage Trax]AXQ64383.1 terminase small subunit [Gordonia phage Neville]QDM55898.1 terminase small subunit [Gordonia phage Trax]
MFDVESLGIAGKELWTGVHAIRKVTPAYEALLFNACRIADRLDELTNEMSMSALTVENAKGDEIANPLMTEHRQQLLALRQVLHGLGIQKLETETTKRKPLAEQIAEAKKRG